MPRKKKEPVEGFNVFQCQLCADKPEFSAPGEFSAHLTEAHQIDPKGKYQRSMRAHIDATDWYQTDYDWKQPDGSTFAIQSVRNPRTPSTRLY